MSARVPLPLRWLHAPPALGGGGAAAAPTASAILAVYKPAGLPYYSASQTAAVREPAWLFSLQPQAGGPSPTPQPEDLSDSLSARLTDTLPMGSTPHIALPVFAASPWMGCADSRRPRDGATEAGAAAPTPQVPTVEQVNARTARYKGVTLVGLTQAHALLLRNAARMGMVTQTFHVLVRLPAGVLAHARSHEAAHVSTGCASGVGPHSSPFLNPYVRAAAARATQRLDTAVAPLEEGVAHGVPLTDRLTGALPSALHREPLLEGGLVDWAAGRLRRRGHLSAVLRAGGPLPASLARVARTRRRLARLFLPPGAAPAGEGEGGAGESDALPPHPWLPASQRWTVSVDDTARAGERAGAAPGHRVRLNYELLALGGNLAEGLALYEVHGANLTAEEVAVLFAAEGFCPLNDYTVDVPLAQLLDRAAGELRRALSADAQAAMPMALRHRLLTASPEELVALPLMRQPLAAADACAVAGLVERLTLTGAGRGGAGGSGMLAAGGADELLERLRRRMDGGGGGSTPALSFDPLRQLLYTTLARSRALSDDEVAALLRLALGPGVECVGVQYPEPSSAPTALALQHAAGRFEEGHLSSHYAEELMAGMHHTVAGVAATGAVQGLVSVTRGWGGLAGGPGGVVEDVSLSYGLALGGAGSLVATTEVPNDYASYVDYWCTRQGLLPEEQEGVPALEKVTGPEQHSYHEQPGTLVPSRAALRALVEEHVSLCEGGPRLARPPSGSGRRSSVSVSGGDGVTSAERPDGDAAVRGVALVESSSASEQRTVPLPQSPLLTPLFVRAEELGTFRCVACGAEGHTWSGCPHTSPAAVPAAQAPLPLPATAAVALPLAELMTSTDEARGAVQAADERRAELAATTVGGGGGGGRGDDEDRLVAVPNVAPTAPLNVHALRRERAKPAMQRRSVRCAYCHGRHHISQCPKLDTSDGGAGDLLSAVGPHGGSGGGGGGGGRGDMTEDGLVELDRARIRAEPARLFCIKCGAHGHLFMDCPRLPENLHPATHCPICQQSVRKGDHTTTQCPRRFSLPSVTAYFPSGVPRDYVVVREGGAAGRRREALRRRRRGSMLVADSFADKS